MNKLLAFVAVAMLSAGANAADKGADIKFGGSMKQKWNWSNNPTFASSSGGQEQDWTSKNQFNISAMTSDKLMGFIGLTHTGVWGANAYNGGKGVFSATAGSVGTPAGATNTNAGQDLLQVTEGWMWWKTSDSFSMKAGRQATTYGSGFIMSKNDDLAFPYFFDGLMARWSWDFADLDFGGAKIGDAGITTGTSLTDIEVVAYAANLSFKTLPDVLKKLDFMVLQLQGDTGTAAAAPNLAIPAIGTSGNTGSWNLMTFGLYGMLDFGMLDITANAAIQSGKQKPAAGTTADTAFSASAYNLQAGVNFPEFMKARLWVAYHMDSGDDSSATATFEGYQPLFYDVKAYSVAGIWGMGNLTNISLGLDLNPSDDTKYGINFNMASRSKENTAPTTISSAYGNHYVAPTNVSATEKSLATTVGLMATHKYGHGLTAWAGFDYIMLGNYYKPATNTTNTGSGMALNLGAKYSF
ncbi:MAG: alginate export family protein [Oligoflexia bacterium]|nr:alginate export family protein [Oligoflexia bacterium]